MAGTAIFVGRLILMAGSLILVRVKLRMVHGLLYGRSTVRLRLVLLHNGRMAAASHRLHDDRSSQRIAAEQRQPDGQDHCNKFSDGV